MTARLLVRLDLLPEAPPLKSGDLVSLHHYSTETRARVRLLESAQSGQSGELAPGSSARVQLRLADRLAAAPGDRFIVRRLSPVQTIGGGVVLDPLPAAPRGRLSDGEIAALDRLESGRSRSGSSCGSPPRAKGIGEEASRSAGSLGLRRPRRARLRSRRAVHAIRRSDRYIAEPRSPRSRRRPAGCCRSCSRPMRPRSAPRSTPCNACFRGGSAVGGGGRGGAAARRARDRRRGGAGREDLPKPERELSERIVDIFRERGLDPPAPSEVATALGRHTKIVEGLIGYLVKKGDLVRLPGGWIVARAAVDDVVSRLRGRAGGSLDVGEFKTLFGLTRKLAIPLLEHLDGAKVTRRVGDRREIVRP